MKINWFGNSSFSIINGKTIFIDPYNIKSSAKADIILITHSHYDHCSTADIDKVSKNGTIIICPASCQSKIARIKNKVHIQPIQQGQKLKIQGMLIETAPAYNIKKPFHPKEEGWVGYVIHDEKIIYHAGDTDFIPEMESLAGKIDIALLPVGGNFTMNAREAAEAAKIIKPELAIPMHFGSIAGKKEDAEEFIRLCKEKGIGAEMPK